MTMTYEEARDILDRYCNGDCESCGNNKLNGGKCDGNDYAFTAINIAIEALEKQIPKKIIVDGYSKILKCNIYGCPNCGDTQNSNEYLNKYCWNCGQALDFTEE